MVNDSVVVSIQAAVEAVGKVDKNGVPHLVAAAVRAADKLRGASGTEKKEAVMTVLQDYTDFPVSETVEALLAFRSRGCRWCK